MRSIAFKLAFGLKDLALLCLLVLIVAVPNTAFADMPLSAKALKVPGIKGDDNRVRVQIADHPWRMIGRLNRNGSHCTAILVGSSFVLTAAHCFWDKRQNKWSVPSAFHFVLGYEKGEMKAHSRIEKFELSNGLPPNKATEKPAVENDWAIAKLAEPLGDQFGYATIVGFDLRDLMGHLEAGANLVQAGYSRDIAHILTADEDCGVSNIRPSKSGPLLLHQCDATKGDSGSPLFLYDGKSYSLIGIHVATLLTSKGATEGIAVSSDIFRERVNELLK